MDQKRPTADRSPGPSRVRPPRTTVPWTLSALLLFATTSSVAAQQEPDSTAPPAPPPPGSSLSVHLLTVEAGDAIWEIFGHNALVVRDAATGYEAAFNYGIFDLSAAGFYTQFLQGLMMYRVQAQSLPHLLDAYRARNRRVWAQELDLEPARKARLLQILQTDVLPENHIYRYDYYRNNCSTKLRDALDTVLDGRLRAATEGAPTGSTWRMDTRRLTSTDAVGYLAINLALGPKGDEPTDRWDEMWIPMKLRDTAGALFVTRADGTRTPLVRSEELWVDSTREHEPVAAPSFDLLFLLSGLAAGVLLSILGYRSAAGSRWGRLGLGLLASTWGLFCFVAGAAFIGVHWTDHVFIYWNQNVLLFSPLGAGVAAGVLRMIRKGRTSVWGRRFVLGALALAVVALILHLIPAASAGNRQFIALALPVHLSLCWVMLGIHRMDHALVYGDSVSARGR